MRKGLVILVFLVLFGLSSVSADIVHSGSNVSVNVSGVVRDLNANPGYFRNYTYNYTVLAYSTLPIGNHEASQVIVSVMDGEMTLFNALRSTNKLCPNVSRPTTYSMSVPNPGHYATEVLLSSGKNLQTAINDGDLCFIDTYSWYTSAWPACRTSSCGGTVTRTVDCRRTRDNTIVPDARCTPPKPSTTATCDCRYVDHGYESCDFFVFWDHCLPGLACHSIDIAPDGWHCIYEGEYPTYSCGFMRLGMGRSVLQCENKIVSIP